MQLRRPTRTFHPPPPTPTISAGPQPFFHLGHSPSAGPLVCSYSRRARRCIPTAVCMQLRGPARTFNPPTPTIPAGPQLCFHFGHVPSAGPLVCSYSRWARRCIPTAVCMPLRGPARAFNSPTPTIPAGPQPCFHLGYSPPAGPLECSHSRWARRCIPTAVCMQLHGPARTFHLPTPTILAGPQLCFCLVHSPSAGPLTCLTPPPLPSQQARSHVPIWDIHRPQAHSYVHTPLWAHRCIPTAVCMQLRGPARTFHPPPPPPSQRVRSYVSISDMYLPQAHSCAHTLSGPAAASPLYADSSAGPVVCSNPPPTPSRRAHSYVSISYMRLPQARLLNTFLPLFGHLGPHVYMKINGIQSPGPLQGDRIHHEIVKVG